MTEEHLSLEMHPEKSPVVPRSEFILGIRLQYRRYSGCCGWAAGSMGSRRGDGIQLGIRCLQGVALKACQDFVIVSAVPPAD